MITLEKIRQKLIDEIKHSGLSQTEIARKVGIKQPTVGQYLSGRAMPALDTFAKLCALLDLDPAEILCMKEYADNNK